MPRDAGGNFIAGNNEGIYLAGIRITFSPRHPPVAVITFEHP